MVEVKKYNNIFASSCNSCSAKNYGDHPVYLYEVEFSREKGYGGMVVMLCEECMLDLVREIADNIGTSKMYSCPYCNDFFGRL